MLSLAQLLLDDQTDLPTQLGSRALRQVDAGVLRHSLFSARMTNADAVQGIRDAVTRILSSVPAGGRLEGKLPGGNPPGQTTDTYADARLKLKALGKALGYDPAAGGFPGQQYKSTVAEPGSIRDLFSTDRLNLILKTQEAQTQGAAKNIWGNEPDALEQYPAWELVRVQARELPRGLIRKGKGVVEVPEDAWDGDGGRWEMACKDAGDAEALRIFQETQRMVARKDSDVWDSLGAGAGGYDDTLGNSYEPYAFNSGMGRVELSAQEFAALGGDVSDTPDPSDTEFGPSEVKVNKSRFDPDILQALKKGMESGDLKFQVKVEVVK